MPRDEWFSGYQNSESGGGGPKGIRVGAASFTLWMAPK